MTKLFEIKGHAFEALSIRPYAFWSSPCVVVGIVLCSGMKFVSKLYQIYEQQLFLGISSTNNVQSACP